MGDSGQTVTQHQDIQPLVSEILGNHMRHVGRFQSQDGGDIGWCGHDHRLGQAFWPQGLADESLYLSTTLTNEPNDHHIGFGKTREHAQKHALAHARTRDQTDALASSYGQNPIDGFDAHIKHLMDGAALHGIQGLAHQSQGVFAFGGRFAVQRKTSAIDHSPKQLGSQGNLRGQTHHPHHVPRSHAHGIVERH